ncbi:MAG TPA: AAA family ATPase [Ktedonobacterales bacterium]|jgi:dephospho-CoA kinase|nr:AAA family ATPase [Ktedonobacterales bacterium]
MKRILITGMSGTGKSSVIAELVARGYKAVDADSPEYSEWVEVAGDTSALGSPEWGARDWMWREDRVQELLSTEDADLLFVSGCAANMGTFLPQFDQVVLLTAPADIIVERLATRPTNTYGKRPEEIARTLELIETIEPRLRRVASHEIDASAPLDEIVAALLRIAHG